MLKPNSVSNEYYLTELPEMLINRGDSVELVDAVAPEDILSINTPQQLTDVETLLLARLQNNMEPTA